MNIMYCDSHSCRQADVLAFIGPGDPFARQKETELGMKLRYGGEKDPEKPPEPEPGDQYIVIGAILGLVVGGIVSAIIGNYCFGLVGGIIGTSVGIIGGGILGARVGKSVKDRQRQTKNSK